MRRSELMGLSVFDLDRERGTVMIRQGKGKKDRMIPIGERALRWIDRYQTQVRPELVIGRGNATLFLTQAGEAFTPDRLTQLVREYVEAANTGKSGSCHLLRHTMATLMLENGADIRYIQAMLGPPNSRPRKSTRSLDPQAQGNPQRYASGESAQRPSNGIERRR